MTRPTRQLAPETSERHALRRRVRQLYDEFNRENYERCFAFLDPNLVEASKVGAATYTEKMAAFKQVYGSIKPWHVRISMHLDGSASKHDPRPFAYVYVIWQDDAHGFHMFRERWIRASGRWYTRVAGLVPNRLAPARAAD